MGFAPNSDLQANYDLTTVDIAPSKTYKFDFETGEFENRIIDDIEAISQFVQKAIITPRFRYVIYNWDYGSELDSLIGQSFTQELITHELPRVIEEAIKFDDRVVDIQEMKITREKDIAVITFNVVLDDDVILEERVVVNV